MKTIYTGGILKLILYGTPEWKSFLDNTCYKAKIIRIQWLINIRIAKAHRTISNEALCVITGIIRINIKIEETAKCYECIKGNENLIELVMEVKHWTNPANSVKFVEGQEDSKHIIHVHTDSSKNEHGLGSGVTMFTDSNLAEMTKYRLNGRCSSNQAEQLAILKTLENIEYLENTERTVLVSTDSRIILQSIKTRKNHTYLIENIRTKLREMEMQNWKIEFNWIKAQAAAPVV